ncbi:cation/H(+) antiporter 15-like [Trifolium pratense]|uniref:cation/H(+) antiporter 15-like n=1 Tax=Trifolium pratense TaxID=57577 RepID=UPI001E6971DA|nr:cation/H(+) antiporter 15-like [Trifolium pratense]XP_045800874.1 cation/H(+) antiporter 15-like [Trifolium pratense]
MQIGILNSTILCHSPYGITHKSVWELGNPLTSPTPLLLLQISMITVVIQFFDACLRPLGQTSLVSQILGGLVFGPSVLGHKKMLTSILFPMKGSVILKTMATFCLNFFYFICCVKMDTVTMLKTEKQAITIGISVFALTLGVPLGLAFALMKYVAMDKTLSDALPVIAVSQSLTVFISISVLLAELKILNTDVGRLTLSSAMFADVVSFSMSVLMFAALQTKAGNSSMITIVWIILSIIALFIVIVYVMRPAILWSVARLHGKPIDEVCILCVIVCVLLTAFISEFIGQHFAMGPIILGLVVPEGPPLGTSLIAKMETVTCGFLYPIYLAVSGLQTDVFKINIQSTWIVTVIVIAGFVVKIGGVMLPGYYYNVPMKECFMIGLLLNGRGIAELTMYNIWKEGKILTEQEFALMVVSLLVINAIIAPLINFLFDHSAPYNSGKRCSIQHTKRDSELRIMACIYKDENIPTMLNVIEASCASKESNVAVIALVLVELLGRSRPILVAHQPHETLRSTKCHSPRLENALKQYEQLNEGCAYIQSFTSISDFDTIHGDVCQISLDRRANIIIMPFHKRWEIDGSVEVNNRAVQAINVKVLERAPCSVGILIDRGILSGSPSLLISNKSTYYVAVLFIGGPDDAEALAYASRMARHECVSVSVVRFLVFGEENSKDRKRDSDLVDEYRYYNVGNIRFEITEEVVKDGIEFSSSIRRMIDYFDLVIVGKGHPQSVLLRGHDQWSECPELGVIGDMLASQDFMTKASVLVVQQQRMGGRLVNPNINTLPNQRGSPDVSIMDEPPRASCSISVDKYDKM